MLNPFELVLLIVPDPISPLEKSQKVTIDVNLLVLKISFRYNKSAFGGKIEKILC